LAQVVRIGVVLSWSREITFSTARSTTIGAGYRKSTQQPTTGRAVSYGNGSNWSKLVRP